MVALQKEQEVMPPCVILLSTGAGTLFVGLIVSIQKIIAENTITNETLVPIGAAIAGFLLIAGGAWKAANFMRNIRDDAKEARRLSEECREELNRKRR